MTLPNADVTAQNLEILGRHHPSVRDVARFLVEVNTNLTGDLWRIAWEFRGLAVFLLDAVADSAELTAALRKLLEAKDCAVRAALPPLDGKAG